MFGRWMGCAIGGGWGCSSWRAFGPACWRALWQLIKPAKCGNCSRRH